MYVLRKVGLILILFFLTEQWVAVNEEWSNDLKSIYSCNLKCWSCILEYYPKVQLKNSIHWFQDGLSDVCLRKLVLRFWEKPACVRLRKLWFVLISSSWLTTVLSAARASLSNLGVSLLNFPKQWAKNKNLKSNNEPQMPG